MIYKSVYCPICQTVLNCKVQVTMIVPSDAEYRLSKKSIRRSEVKIVSVDWSKSIMVCPICDWGN